MNRILEEKMKGMTILLVDDNEDLVDTVRFGFAAKGVSLTGVTTPSEALRLLEQQPFDVIITDYRMDGINGLEFLERIRDLSWSPIRIMISAFQTHAVVKRAYDLGVDDFIPKPFEGRSIEESLISIISNRQQSDAVREQ